MEMKENIRSAVSGVIFIIVTFFTYWGSIYYSEKVEKQFVEKANEIFDLVIQKDKAQRMEESLSYFYFEKQRMPSSSKSITISTAKDKKEIKQVEKSVLYEKKKYIADQLFLLYKNPICTTRLDSLFQAALQEKELPAKTAVIYRVNGKSEHSNPDSLFYRKATALKPVSIGDIIHLQGYVKFNDFDILIKTPQTATITWIWGFCVLLIVGYNFLKWREWKIFSMLNLVVSSPSPDNVRIKDNLFFNTEKGEIKHGKNLILLTKKSTELLKFLLQSNNRFQTYESIKKEVWENTSTSNDAVRNAVNRLNKELEVVPGIYVKKLHKKGLQLCVKTQE